MQPTSAGEMPGKRRRPKLRGVDPQWVQVDGEPHLWLRDPLQLTSGTVLVPAPLVPLVAGCDGTRDLDALALDFVRRTGQRLAPGLLERIIASLDDALLLEGPRQQEAVGRVRSEYRAQPFRPPALAGHSYPASPAALDATCEGYGDAWPGLVVDQALETAAVATLAAGVGPLALASMAPISRAAGVLTPHIDYQRGGPVYAATWMAALPAVASAEVVVVFGTDHNGSAGRLTPTRQRYATPWGALPTDTAAVDALAGALGVGLAYDEELHHRREHSIELAAVWLHWALRHSGRPSGAAMPLLIPVLCGSFHPYVQQALRPDRKNGVLPESETPLARALDALRIAVGGRRALVVSAADLAHVGPAFGDGAPLDDAAKLALAASDSGLLAPALRGDASAFLGALRGQADRTRVCGLPPTYWALRLLEHLDATPTGGRLAGYRQCPADEGFGSVVSIAGVLWEP